MLEACGPSGWGTPVGGRGTGLQLLALRPDQVFSGGLEALEHARCWIEARCSPNPFSSLLIGWLSYDLGRAFERLPVACFDDPPVAPVHLSAFQAVYCFDRDALRGRVIGGHQDTVELLHARVQAACNAGFRGRTVLAGLPRPRSRTSDAEFTRGITTIQDWIHQGDVYQVNLSRRLDLEPYPDDCLPALYERVTSRFGAPFSAYLDTGDTVILSNSPERFLRIQGDRAETCPIKGTRPRGRSHEEDASLAKELLNSSKDRAEHVMIVDLERNDLGRICHTGSIEVRNMAELQTLATVFHLVSSVRGRLRNPRDWLAILRAMFPGGSITGAPKLRAMEIIESLEPVRRGIYTGALGYFDAAGGADLSLVIRTAVRQKSCLTLHLGAGIVADSNPDSELLEVRNKGRAFSSLWEPRG